MSRLVPIVEAQAVAELADLLGDELGLRLLFELQLGPSNLAALAGRCNVAEASLSPLLHNLERRGIVDRREDVFSLGSVAVHRFLVALGGIEDAGTVRTVTLH
jgi:DNA-binding HxlR family transcriptional regulator